LFCYRHWRRGQPATGGHACAACNNTGGHLSDRSSAKFGGNLRTQATSRAANNLRALLSGKSGGDFAGE
jgi:hypothetical protein